MKEAEFHKAVGGNKRIDQRFVEDNHASQIRQLLVDLRRRGMIYKDIAILLSTSISSISMAAGGRAGLKLGKDGQSTTEKILDGLIDLSNKK